jgi:hypothetical protein
VANMTIAVDDQLLRAARIKAVQQGTSVNEVCRQAIESFARGAGDAQARMARLKVLAKKVRSEDLQPLWPGRDALYAETPERVAPLTAVPSKKPSR